MTNQSAGVLLVEDDFHVLGMLSSYLQSWGFRVFVAESGPAAIALHNENAPAIRLVVMDLQMPGMDGVATLAALRRIDPAVRCCFMTGDHSAIAELLKLEPAAVLEKPFRLPELAETVALLMVD